MEPHILLKFGTSFGNSRVVRVNNADRTVTDQTVVNSMNRILGSQALVTLTTGVANSLRRAVLVETEIIPLDIGVA